MKIFKIERAYIHLAKKYSGYEMFYIAHDGTLFEAMIMPKDLKEIFGWIVK